MRRHGIDVLVEAVARVKTRLPGVRLEIYGAWTNFVDEILEMAGRLGIADIVRYHGAKNQTSIAEAVRNCHLGVVPNRRSAFTEINFPTRLFEYLSMCRPVIAPATQGIRDYFAPEELLMFEPDNVEDLADQILWAHAHPEQVREIVERGRQIYRQHRWSQEKERFVGHAASLVVGA